MYKVYFSDQKPTRSNRQNRYLWGVVYKTIADETGYDAQEIHEIMKLKFSLRTTFDFAGEMVESTKSTTLMDTGEMADYIDSIIKWAAEHFITIPEANALPDEAYIGYIESGK